MCFDKEAYCMAWKYNCIVCPYKQPATVSSPCNIIMQHHHATSPCNIIMQAGLDIKTEPEHDHSTQQGVSLLLMYVFC